jgi:hypothetical protein
MLVIPSQFLLTEMTADAVRPVRTVRFAVMNLKQDLVKCSNYAPESC